MSTEVLPSAREGAATFAGRARERAARLTGQVRSRAADLARPLEPVAARARPVLEVVQPGGWAVLATGLAAWWAGRHWGWTELVVVAVACFAVLAIAVAFVVGRSEYRVELELTRRRVVVGSRAVGRIAVTNTAGRPQLASEVELPVGASGARFSLPRLAAGETYEEPFTVPTARRAVIPVGPVRSVRGDGLGLLRREKRWTETIELFVHPRTVALHGSTSGFLKDLEGRPTRDLSPSDVSFHALREYAPGDDRRHVHWKTTARTGTLMVRQFEETRRSHLVVVLSLAAADYDDPDELELAISVAGSLALQALREERDVTVIVQGQLFRGRSGAHLLDELTRLDLTSRGGRLAELAREVGEQVPDASAAVLLHGATVPPALVHLAGTRLPIDVRPLAVRCVPGAPVVRRTLGALPTVDLGKLDDLPFVMRRAAT